MKVMLTNRNQITIPKNLVNKLGLELGKYYEMTIKEGRIELDISQAYNEAKDSSKIILKDNKLYVATSNNNVKKSDKLDKNKKPMFRSKITNNLEESKTFTRQVISECRSISKNKKILFK